MVEIDESKRPQATNNEKRMTKNLRIIEIRVILLLKNHNY